MLNRKLDSIPLVHKNGLDTRKFQLPVSHNNGRLRQKLGKLVRIAELIELRSDKNYSFYLVSGKHPKIFHTFFLLSSCITDQHHVAKPGQLLLHNERRHSIVRMTDIHSYDGYVFHSSADKSPCNGAWLILVPL